MLKDGHLARSAVVEKSWSASVTGFQVSWLRVGSGCQRLPQNASASLVAAVASVVAARTAGNSDTLGTVDTA